MIVISLHYGHDLMNIMLACRSLRGEVEAQVARYPHLLVSLIK